MQRYLKTTHRTAVWFKKAFEGGDLVIQPPFQRNPVWSVRQQSALIDTILLEYPIPELYIQEITDGDGNQKHYLVDGQQRIRAVLDFLSNELELDEESPRWAGLSFEDLSQEDKKRVYEYDFVVRVLPEMPPDEVRGIFQRLNRNTMTLNSQELRHATYWGPFIKLMEDISDIEFWESSGIFSANDRRRMVDVEFISELTVAHLNGLQNKKKMLEEYYQQYEKNFEQAENVRSIFTSVLGELSKILPELSKTRWRKKSDFYSLFLCFSSHVAQLPLPAGKRTEACVILTTFSNWVDAEIRGEVPEDIVTPEHIQVYLRSVERAASDLGSRFSRDKIIRALLFPIFGEPKAAELTPKNSNPEL